MNDQIRSAAADAFNASWDALDEGEFEPALNLAIESLELWKQIGGPRELCMGEWMVGRTQALAGDFESSRKSAERAEQHLDSLGAEAEDWLHASIAELKARTYSNEPKSVAYLHLYETAQMLIGGIHDKDDRELIEDQFSDLAQPA